MDLSKGRCLVFLLGVWFAWSGAWAQEESAKGLAGTATGAQERSGVSTGLGELALSRAYPDAAVWLDLEEGDRALGLFHPERELPAKGALLVLADAGETAASGVSGSLAEHLADRGWAVLTVGLDAPSPTIQRLLERPPEVVEKSPGDGEASSVMIDVMESESAEGGAEAAYRDRVRRVLEAGVTELADREYGKVALVGIGRASNHLVALSEVQQNLRAMIWVAPVFYPRDEATLVSRLGEGNAPPLLELYDSVSVDSAPGRQWALNLLRAGLENFVHQPAALHQPLSAQDGQSLASRINGWLKTQ
ncbi:hypothetical protein BKP64_17275 [Marinobacter salinus]|uniref:DUF3530 domain-containing protein n=1 Tax=Marinobacter salinus TaxID=1874317 RepID=A0A1D9GRU2_9GAMM|nr:hypothetical protein BKP64_17275 [Marinobacter salinus]